MPLDDLEGIPEDSSIHRLTDWMEQGPDEVDKVWGHIGGRTDDGEWHSFQFEVLDANGDQHSISIFADDLGDDIDWDQLFDWLEDFADEYDIDYENPYGEK